MAGIKLTLHGILCHTVPELTPTFGGEELSRHSTGPQNGVDATAVRPREWAARDAGEMAMNNTIGEPAS